MREDIIILPVDWLETVQTHGFGGIVGSGDGARIYQYQFHGFDGSRGDEHPADIRLITHLKGQAHFFLLRLICAILLKIQQVLAQIPKLS